MYRSSDFDDDLSMDLDIYGIEDMPAEYASSSYGRQRRSTNYGSSSSYSYGGGSKKYADYHSTSHLPQASNWWYDVGGPDLELYKDSDGYAALVLSKHFLYNHALVPVTYFYILRRMPSVTSCPSMAAPLATLTRTDLSASITLRSTTSTTITTRQCALGRIIDLGRRLTRTICMYFNLSRF